MENAESECREKDRQKSVCPGLSPPFTIKKDDYKDTEHDPTIDENKEEFIKKFSQWEIYLNAKLIQKVCPNA
jgi:hypothetical protein